MSKSSTVVEYRAVAYTIAETILIRKLLHDLRIHLSAPTRVYCGNISASNMAVNPVQHDRSKHIAVHYHFVRERVVYGDLVVCYILTTLQLQTFLQKDCLLSCLIFSGIICQYVPLQHIKGV